MNVLLVVPWDNLGGVCGVVNHVALHLRERGHGAFLMLPGESEAPQWGKSRLGLPAVRLNLRPMHVPGRGPRGLAAFAAHLPLAQLRLGRLLRELEIDVVNVHYPTAGSIHFAIARRFSPFRLVTSVHGADLLPYNLAPSSAHYGVNIALSASNILVAPSRTFLDAAAPTWPALTRRPTYVIPNGVDPDELGYDVAGAWGELQPPYVLAVSTLVAYKGVDVLIRAFARISDEMPALRLRLVSGGPDRLALESLATDLGVRHRVDFLGMLERREVARELRGATLFVMPSRSSSESFGIAAAEAMAVDRAVIASAVGALPEMIEHDRTGLLVPPGDDQALAAAMRLALSHRELRERLGRAAGIKVRRDYRWSRTGAEYESLLLRVATE